MRVIIAGAGEVGTHLAKMLSQENQDIVLMDPNEERLRFTDASLDIMPMVGSPTSPRDLDEAGIKKTDLFVSVMPEETSNITACMLAQAGDVILVAGKGHENYQEIKGVKHHFDDKEVLAEIFDNE